MDVGVFVLNKLKLSFSYETSGTRMATLFREVLLVNSRAVEENNEDLEENEKKVSQFAENWTKRGKTQLSKCDRNRN